MKRFFKTAWIILCIALISVYIISSLSTFIPPSRFSYISLLSIGFPYILPAFILCCIINLFTVRKLGYIMLIVLPTGYFNTVNTFALRKEIPWQSHKDAATLRIMTWNVQGFINYLHKNKSTPAYRTARFEMLETIHAYDPDIICFQEYVNIENAKRRIPVKRQLDSLGYKYFFCSNDKIKSLTKNPAAL
ncbi:MAG TPA: endonuclease/exonuclease/phosphatase family protein [Chitinophagaceae bacterium]|nr:endonuclease/exonuclease/phosphatase family protein [Chitinophagaceae bacterium]